jgi:hypothetical protein
MTKNEKGFGAVGILLIIAALGIIGFAGWRVYKANQEAPQAPNNNSAEQSKTTPQEETIPQGWEKYENKDLGFSFAYPAEWGEVVQNDGYESYEGGHYLFSFSENDQFKVAAKTADYKYTGMPRGGLHVDGFTDFDERYQEILKFEQGLEGYEGGDVVAKSANSIVYTGIDGVDYNVVVHGIAKTNKLPGLDFALAIPFSAFDLSDQAILELSSGKTPAKDYLSKEQIDTVITFTEHVKSL